MSGEQGPGPTFTRDDDLKGARFRDVDLSGARFVEADLSGVVMRGVEVARIDIDAPWLVHGEHFRVNGVDVIAFVEAELDRRYPGRADRRATDPDGLRAAWGALERAWAGTRGRAAALPEGAVERSVDGEWSFAQTLRHLVHATDMWFRKGILGIEDPFHPIGLGDVTSGVPDSGAVPSYAQVLEVREERVALVREYLADVSAEELSLARPNPHDPAYPETVLSCLHVVLEEEWEHLRFAVRDLEAIEAAGVT